MISSSRIQDTEPSTRGASATGNSGTLIALLVVSLLGCCAMSGEKFREYTRRVEEKLIEGVSTQKEVLRVIGRPLATGEALIPPGSVPRDVWYYAVDAAEEVEKSSPGSKTANGYIKAETVRRGILLFFQDGLFAGYMFWGGETEAPKGQRQ